MNIHPYPPLPVQTFHGVHTRAGNNVHHRARQLRDENFAEAALQGRRQARLEREFSAVATVLEADNFVVETEGMPYPSAYINPT